MTDPAGLRDRRSAGLRCIARTGPRVPRPAPPTRPRWNRWTCPACTASSPPWPRPLRTDRVDRPARPSPAWSSPSSTAGVHGLWVLGTTARFDLLPDAQQRTGRRARRRAGRGAGVPLVLNVSDMGTAATLARARMFDDLPYDYYAALPPWYQPMTGGRGRRLLPRPGRRAGPAPGHLQRPLDLQPARLRRPPAPGRAPPDRRLQGRLPRAHRGPSTGPRRAPAGSASRYLHGNDLLALSTDLGADGFVTSLAEPLPRAGRRASGTPPDRATTPGPIACSSRRCAWAGSPGSARPRVPGSRLPAPRPARPDAPRALRSLDPRPPAGSSASWRRKASCRSPSRPASAGRLPRGSPECRWVALKIPLLSSGLGFTRRPPGRIAPDNRPRS